MKVEISLPSIPWKLVGIVALLLGMFLYWWLGVRPYLRIKDAVLRAATSELFATAPGVVAIKTWEEGDLFQKGELLSSFLSEQVSVGAELQEAQTLLAQEKATLEEIMQAYIQAQTEGQPAEVIDQILLRVQRTQQNIANAEEEIARLQKSGRVASQPPTVVAPFDGMILRAFKQSGQWVASGEPLLSVCDRNRLWVEVMIPEARLDQIKVGMPAIISFPSFAGRQWKAKIERIGSLVEQGCVRVRLVAPELPLRPGLSAQVTFRLH